VDDVQNPFPVPVEEVPPPEDANDKVNDWGLLLL